MECFVFDMRRLRHALALAEYRNFARAADALHITQPALSRSIQSLEDGLGVRLFDRSPRDVQPTAFGELVCVMRAESNYPHAIWIANCSSPRDSKSAP